MSNFEIHELTEKAINRNSNIVHDTLENGSYATGKNLAGAVADLASANVAAPYDTTVTYAIGQYCLYEGDIYRCIAITTGAFDSTAWTQIVVTGEFRRVVELTSAQYGALSSAEKNNGTLYVITDEEATAADIPYSAGVSVADKLDNVPTFDTLTTSDNNKLLGVIVSGSDISVGAVGIETITLTPQTGINVSGSVSCKKFGNIAVVSIQNVTFANTGVNQLLIKDAPKALGTVYSSKPAGSNLNNTNNIAPNIAYVDNNGYIYFNIHASNTTQHWISLVYPCEQ